MFTADNFVGEALVEVEEVSALLLEALVHIMGVAWFITVTFHTCIVRNALHP